jgi:hypothetical protein
MFDINNFIEDKIEIVKSDNCYYLFYNKKKIQFYLKKSFTITKITEYKGKKNILVKIDNKYNKFFEKIKKIFLKKFDINHNEFIDSIRTNEKGSIIKLKINKRNKKIVLDVFNQQEEYIGYEEIEKYQKVNCLIEIDRIWDYRNKFGIITILKKITLE